MKKKPSHFLETAHTGSKLTYRQMYMQMIKHAAMSPGLNTGPTIIKKIILMICCITNCKHTPVHRKEFGL